MVHRAGVRADGAGTFLAYGGVVPADCSNATLAPAVLPIPRSVTALASTLASCAPGLAIPVAAMTR